MTARIGIFTHQGNMKFSELNARLLPSFATLVTQWLPSGKRMGEEWVALNPTRNDTKAGSFRVNMNTGKWADFATNDNGGDPISLYAYLHNMEQIDAAKELASHEGLTFVEKRPAPKPAIKAEAITIVPDNAPALPTHFKHGKPTMSWAYRDQAGQLLGYICRYDTADGKEILPLTWVDGKWTWKSFPKPRPLYGLEKLAANPTATVMMVEGEKAADAAQALFPQLVVLTWAGGSKAVKHADFAPLAGRKIILAPDADEPGVAAMLDVAEALPQGCQMRWVNPPEGVDQGWDFADADPSQDWKAYIKANLSTIPEKIDTTPGHVDAVNNNVPAQQRLTAGAIDTYSPLPDMSPRFKPMATIENISEICQRLNVTIRYNVISKEEELLIPGESYSVDNMANASFAWLQSWCARFNMPTDKLGDFVTYLAERNLYNPVAQWVTSKPWDGVPRLQAFCDTIKAHGEEDNPTILNMKRTLMKRWMISAIAAAFQPNGVSAHGVLVLQGDQYVGKTKWFKSLVPEHLGLTQDGMMLRPDDKDSVKQAVSFWLVELGELDATFRKSDIAALKAFLTRKNDVLRRAYARKESHFARRTVFFASVNPQQFLHDPTGNRRYWTISAREIDHSHSLDMQQVWAEVLTMFNAGETYFLLPEEMDALNHSNEEFTVIDPIQERIISKLDWKTDQAHWHWKSVTDILVEVGMERPTQSDCTKAAGYIRQLNGGQGKKSNGARVVRVPPKKSW